ncbi:uncharacterized protein C20orf96 homolog isoform X3 [Gallus gallus]|uniref:uncharacterized protein C20orf96 homolog isoform X3 n=1 Tax=Gallus gallus TaxID=9031 RepID=UPI0003504DD9|nr:uncharacterized protein C20orf96 homolog isoform X3 [Gallus gallus]|eukprot:XP_004947210.1 uncharacterized protein C20orf96 homolog isoform X2 [Gallus gallus]
MDAKGPGPSAAAEAKRRVGSTWQKAAAERKLAAHELVLPPITDGAKKKGQKNKSAVFVSSKTTPLVLKASPQEKYRTYTERKSALKEAELAEMLEEIRVTTMIEAMTQTVSQNQLDMARAELQEMEKTMEKNVGKLQQQLDEVTSKVQVLQDELSTLRAYTEVQYLNQAMQIVLLLSNIQNLKKQQQDEIEQTEKMGQAILEELEKKAQLEQEEILQKVVEEVLLHQDGLKQMVINNHVLRREIIRQKEIIKDLEEEISELKRSVQTLRQSARDPREMIFADVFLHRPKCTPDTEVVLRIPTEETPLPRCPQRSDEEPTNAALPSPAALLPPGPARPL